MEEIETELYKSNKVNKALREELRTASRRYEELEEETAIKSLEVKDLKQKKLSNETELKEEVFILNEELSNLSKELRVTKDTLKVNIRKLDSLEDELAIKNIECKDVKQKRILYDATEELKSEILTQREEVVLLTKDNRSLKEELRSNRNSIEELEEALATKNFEGKDLRQKLNTKELELSSAKH